MDLILWRHADAEDGANDLARRLTPNGEKQAAAMANWLRTHLPRDYTVLASPAVRAQQTAAALGAKIITDNTLAPGATVVTIAKAVEKYRGLVIVVGHQPDLGRAAAHLVGARGEWEIAKGAIWWLAGDPPAHVKAVLSP
ncbi:MAG TPA: histidine phosphatase family protein, partial [Burkholderiales bacterium]|nr:histidine phosphatase family protein [Burkholderiales bacterium]